MTHKTTRFNQQKLKHDINVAKTINYSNGFDMLWMILFIESSFYVTHIKNGIFEI